ncbi:thioredoxin [Ramaria rubella]|nr:thioredoxin [Ramaria rubella]
MGVKEVKSLAEFKEIINSDEVSVFDFWATWCGPCRVISPVFEKLSKEIEGIKYYKVDVDEQPDIAEEVGIRSLPTFKAFKNRQVLGETIGAVPAALETLIKTHAVTA